jgi:hypothetical protein
VSTRPLEKTRVPEFFDSRGNLIRPISGAELVERGQARERTIYERSKRVGTIPQLQGWLDRIIAKSKRLHMQDGKIGVDEFEVEALRGLDADIADIQAVLDKKIAESKRIHTHKIAETDAAQSA